MIRVTSYPISKDNGKGNNNNSNGFANNKITTKITTGVEGVNIWGQYHDHTRDVSGDMTGVGNITSNGNITTTGNVNAKNITATNNVTSNKVITGDINSSGNLTTNNITANGTIDATSDITTEGDMYCDNLTVEDTIHTDKLFANYLEFLEGIGTDLTVENLTVTKAAHFFKLIIDEIKATKGQIIVTPANAKVDYVTSSNNQYNLYFRAIDPDTNKKIHNMFEVNDQILCQTFDVAEGVNYDVSNRFYWSKCIYVSTTPVDMTLPNGETAPCHYITLDWTDKDTHTNATPMIGDEIVMLGNRTDTTRQAAITIGAYNNPYLDSGINAPFIIQYDGINDYNLSNHRVNVISKGYNYFKGEFYTSTGDDIEDLIADVSAGALTYMHTAYSNSATGQLNFSKTYFVNALYIGFCSNHTQSDAALVYTDYTWCRLRGANGTSASTFQLSADSLSIHCEADGTTTDDDFYVRGYEFDAGGRVEINNQCTYSFIYDTGNPFTRTDSLPILVSPERDQQSLENGLKKIRYQMWDEDEAEVVAELEIPVIRDGADGQDGDSDALEEYKLVPIAETVPIDKNGTVGVQLQYNIVHIVGDQYELATATNNLCVYFKPHFQTSVRTYTALSTGTTTPSYTSNNYQSNWNTSNNKLLYLDIVLASSNPDMVQPSGDPIIYDKRVVYAALAPSATFQITDEIKSVVQGHTQDINGITNSISTITQQYNNISSTVESHTTAISNLDGRVTTNETNISNITQRADSIESTVQKLRVGSKNLFNFMECRWQNTVPLIQAYGIEGKGTLNRITKLGFDGIGGDFAVSCWMRMQTTNSDVNVNICDVNDPTQQTVRVTTEWKYYQFVFNNVTRYIGDASDTSNYNGFLDFESSNISTTNRLYVRELMVVRGNIPCDFNFSWKDYENVNTDNLIEMSYDENIAPTDERYKGYVVYKPTQYNLNDGEYTDFIYANNLSLKQNKPYTLSFYAKCEHPCIIETYLKDNGGLLDGTASIKNDLTNASEGEMTIENLNDGYTGCRLGTHWTQFIIHWYNQNTGNRNLIALRDSIDNWDDTSTTPNISICGVEFREGYWDVELLNSQSLIRQTATSIEMAVNNTGINIYDGSITLNAENTTINGNLNLTNTNQGLILYDQYGNPKISIQNDTLGTLDNFNFGQDKYFSKNATSNVNTQIYNVSYPTVTLGNFAAGQKLEIHDIIVNSFNTRNVFDTPITRVTYSYIVKCGNTTVTTQSGTATTVNKGWKLSDYTNNALSNSGTYTIQVNISCNLQSTQYTGDFNHTLGLYCKIIQPSINKIATDGAVFSSGVDKYNWFGSDQTMIRNGATAIRIKDGHIERNEYNSINPYYNTNFSDISTTMPFCIVNDLTYTATLNDGFITFNTVIGQADSAQRILYLPNPSTCAGKKYYVKNKVGSNTRVYVSGAAGTDKYFMEHNTNVSANNIGIDNHSTILISDGFHWMEYYC